MTKTFNISKFNYLTQHNSCFEKVKGITTSGCNDIGVRKMVFVIIAQLHCFSFSKIYLRLELRLRNLKFTEHTVGTVLSIGVEWTAMQ